MKNGNSLFTPTVLGALELKHRVIMAPLTRSRSVQPDSVPGDLMREYYAQRASDGGLIISEATNISLTSRGWLGAPASTPIVKLTVGRRSCLPSTPRAARWSHSSGIAGAHPTRR